MSEYCVSCGIEIPDGSYICIYCEKQEKKQKNTNRIPYYCKKVKIKGNSGKKEKREA